jgi:PAS domain S-box-containing protein
VADLLTPTPVGFRPVAREITVLVLNDSQTDAEATIRELQQGGFKPQWKRAQTESEFLIALHETPDLILSDYHLRQFDCFRALDLLRKRRQEIPCIVIAAAIGEELAVAAIRRGVHDYLLKNRLGLLPEAVSEALNWKRLRDEQRQADDRRRAVETLFRTLSENSLAGIQILQDGKYVYANDKIAEIFGYTIEELLNLESWKAVVAVEDLELVIDQVRRRVSGETPHAHYIFRGVRKDRTPIDLEIRSNRIEFQGQPAVLGMLLDVSERRRTEESLRASEERFRNAFDLTHVPMVLTDIDNHFVRVNGAFAELLGYTTTEMLRLSLASITHPDDLPQSVANRIPLLAGVTDYFQMEKRYIHKDGHVIWGLTNVSLIRDASGEPRQYVGQVQDITERQRALQDLRQVADDLATANQVIEQERAQLAQRVTERTLELSTANQRLADANKELEAFSYSVSHDLRAPLRGIDGFSRIILEEYGPQLDAEGQRLLNVVRGESQRMGHLIDDLLSFSRLGRQPMQTTEIDLTEMAQSVVDGLPSAFRKRARQFQLNPLPPATGDSAMLRQVLVNLISNAFKFTSQKSDAGIEVGGSTDGTLNTYYIKDNGVGFDQRYAHKLFGVFQRLHSESEFEGTGVGLALVQRIIFRHGGTVSAEGKPNAGATFYFTLPVQKQT